MTYNVLDSAATGTGAYIVTRKNGCCKADHTTNQPTNHMEQNPSWEVDSHWASQEISRLLWNQKVHYRVHKNLPLVPILSQMNPVHALPHPKIYSSVTFPYTRTSSMWCLIPMRAARPAYPIFFDFITLIILGEAYKLWSPSLCSLLQPPATSSLLVQIFSSASWSQTLTMHSSLSVSYQTSHPYKTTGKIIASYILMFKFL
jgi:hypothetical protein